MTQKAWLAEYSSRSAFFGVIGLNPCQSLKPQDRLSPQPPTPPPLTRPHTPYPLPPTPTPTSISTLLTWPQPFDPPFTWSPNFQFPPESESCVLSSVGAENKPSWELSSVGLWEKKSISGSYLQEVREFIAGNYRLKGRPAPLDLNLTLIANQVSRWSS